MSSEEEEVADDYRVALEELSMNNRTEIVNLTSIARDYTAHALKIAEVLQQHIIKVRKKNIEPAGPCLYPRGSAQLADHRRRLHPTKSCQHSTCSTRS
jgi:pre-mRNA cleavage complex 2 protein Pcf11